MKSKSSQILITFFFTFTAVVEKTFSTKPEKDLIGGTINQDVQENKTSDDHTSEDMEFEVVSVSSTEEEMPVKRSHSYDEAINLENSSDFCNGQLANIAKELDSSTSIQDSKPQQQGDFQEKGILDSMEIVDLPSGESMEHGLGEEGESGNTTNEKTDNLEKLPDTRMDTTNDNTGTGNVESTPKMDISKGGEISISNETGSALSESSNKGSLSAENVENPQLSPNQNDGEEDVIRDSGTVSTENTVYEPSWSQDGGHEQQVINGIKTLDVRKRKSPDRDIPDAGKKPHLSVNQSDGDGNGNKQDPNEEGTEDDDQTTDEEDDDEEEDEDGDDENAADDDDNGHGKKIDGGNNNNENTKLKKTKKKGTVKKKGRVKYKKKKGQLIDKSTDSKKEETKDGSSNKVGRKKDELPKSSVEPKAPDKQEKTKDNEKVKSQIPKSNEKKNSEKSNKKSSNELKSNESTDSTSSGSNSKEVIN